MNQEIRDSFDSLVDSFVASLPRLGLGLAIGLVGYVVYRLLRWGLRHWLRRNHGPSFAQVLSTLVAWVVLFVFVLAALAAAFPSVKPVDVLAGLGFFSIAIGFAFQDVLENTLSGVLLLIRQPFVVGDQIEVIDEFGTVEQITIRETRLRTFDGQLLVIPNRDVYKNKIRVLTYYDDRRMSFVVGIAYENDAAEACRVIQSALATVPGVSAARQPESFVTALGVSTVDIEARLWCGPRQHDAVEVTSAAIVAVKQALDDAGIEMPADIVALQATPSFKAALQNSADVTPGGGVRSL